MMRYPHFSPLAIFLGKKMWDLRMKSLAKWKKWERKSGHSLPDNLKLRLLEYVLYILRS